MATQICRKKWRWIGHTLEKTQDCVTRQALFWNPQGRRKQGRPKLAWKPSVDQELHQSRSDWQKIARQAEDCSEWCAFVDAMDMLPIQELWVNDDEDRKPSEYVILHS